MSRRETEMSNSNSDTGHEGRRPLFEPRETIYNDALEGRQFDAVYFSMMVFACLIALLGLLLNSPAVIIGAMLISPLMGPILACGLALTTAEGALGKKAARNLVLSVMETLLIAALATYLSPLRDATPEILARTNPNLMDLLIAFFSGLAGTVALASRKSAFTILPGVAIATAVMPPLAVAGYGISTRQWSIAGGALMLFITNFAAIVLSASIVFLLLGFRPRAERIGTEHRLLVRWRIVIAAVVVVAISFPLMRTLTRAVHESKLRNQIRAALRTEFRKADQQLDSLDVEIRKTGVRVDASVQTAHYIEPHEISSLQEKLAKSIGAPVDLTIQQLQLARKPTDPAQIIRDVIAAGVVRPAKAEKHTNAAVEFGNLQERIEKSLDGVMKDTGLTAIRVQGVRAERDGAITLNVSAQAPQFTAAQMWQVAAAAIGEQIDAPVNLRATIAIIGSRSLVHYRGTAEKPSAKELRSLRALLEQPQPGAVSFAFAASANTDPSLAQSRIAYLRSILTSGPADLEPSAPTEDNSVVVVPMQTVAVQAGTATAPQNASTPETKKPTTP